MISVAALAETPYAAPASGTLAIVVATCGDVNALMELLSPDVTLTSRSQYRERSEMGDAAVGSPVCASVG